MSRAYRHPSRICLDDDQQQQHSRTSSNLQRANYIAGELLITLHHFHRDPRQHRQVRAEITAIAYWMNFFLEECEQIVAQTAEPRPDLIKLSSRVVCDRCKERLRSRRHNDGQTDGHEDLAPDSVWEAQVRFLLARSNRVASYLFEQACCSSNLKKFPECLTKLTDALLRQQRHLEQIGAEETKLVVEARSGRCAKCGQALEGSPEPVH